MIKAVFFGAFAREASLAPRVDTFVLYHVTPLEHVAFVFEGETIRLPERNQLQHQIKTDLDDTLVPTTSADRKALDSVEAELRTQYTNPGHEAHSVVDAFREALRASPWDPEGTVDSDTWRRNLWLRSLQEHVGKSDKDRDASPLRRLAHECWSLWSSTRLENCRMSQKTVDALRLLREEKNNIRLGVITNGSANVQLQKLVACGVASFVDVIFIGDDIETCSKTKQAFRDDDVDACITKGGDDCESKLLPGEKKEDGVKAAAEKAAAEEAAWFGFGLPAERAASSSSTTPIFIHRAKPCASIFLAACAAAGCSPGEAVMVGDSLEMDVCGAENAGFAAAVLVTEGKDKEESQKKNADLAQCQHEGGNRKRSATDDGDKTTACFACDTKTNIKNSDNSKILFLQCSTVSQVPNLLRELRLLY